MRKEKTQDSGNRSTQETNSLKEKGRYNILIFF